MPIIQGTVEIPLKKVFEDIAFNLQQSLTWGDGEQFSKEVIEANRTAFRSQVDGMRVLLTGTHLCPLGTPLENFCGTVVPEHWIPFLEELMKK